MNNKSDLKFLTWFLVPFVGILLLSFTYLAVRAPEVEQGPLCDPELYAGTPPPKEHCSGQWARACNAAGFWYYQCYGGEANLDALKSELLKLKAELEKASSTATFSPEGI